MKYFKILLQLLTILILLTSILPQKPVYALASTSSFGLKNEEVYNVNQIKFLKKDQSKVNKVFSKMFANQPSFESEKELEGKLITSNNGKVVRLVDITKDGEYLVNEGKNPNVISIKTSLLQATATPMSGTICSDQDYIAYLSKYGFKSSISKGGKTYKLNATLTRKSRVVVYGNPDDVPNNSKSGGQWEFLGFSNTGGWIMNDDYPPDVTGNGPSTNSAFFTTDEFTGAARSAYAMSYVYTGQPQYSQAVSTINYFYKWGSKITSRASASWWLDNANRRIKLQGLHSKYNAGLGVTQYKSPATGRIFYQTYMVIPTDLPVTCETVDDIKANSLTAKRSSASVSATLVVANNNSDKSPIYAPNNIPWKLTWKFTGTDSKGNSVSKSGSTSDTKTPYYKTLQSGKTYSKSYLFNPGLNTTWKGTISITAEVNPAHVSGLEETTYSNNDASTTLSWTGTPPPTTMCTLEDVDVQPRYEYKIDFSVNKIEAQTVESGTNTTTKVTAERKNYSAEREAAKNAIKADIQSKEQKKIQLTNQLKTLENEKADLQSDLEAAQKKNPVDQAEVDSIQSAIDNKELQIKAKKCEIEQNDLWIEAYKKELADLEADEVKYANAQTDILLTLDSNEVGKKTVNLVEGEVVNLTYVWILDNDGELTAEIDPEQTYDEVTFENNIMSTPIYIASHESAICSVGGGVSSVSGVVRTITDTNGTTELMEYLSGAIANQSRTEMRAGFGFSYNVQTSYSNQDPSSSGSGPSFIHSYFPTLVNYLPYTSTGLGYLVPMDLLSSNGGSSNESKNWGLPRVYVEEYSGNLFDSNYATHSKHNPNDKILDGGRKWYVDFNQPDGDYEFQVMSSEAGINRLSVCMNSTVKVKGSIIGSPDGDDDFIRRTVTPNNPFPGGTGWNWTGLESLITKLQNWWNNPPSNNPLNPPNSFYKSMVIDLDKLKKIKEYNKKNGMNVKLDDQFKREIGGY